LRVGGKSARCLFERSPSTALMGPEGPVVVAVGCGQMWICGKLAER
jgi:hypothetical protein